MEIYQKIMKEYSFGQAWDTQGWFWKPSEAAKEKVTMIESGSNLDFGDYSSGVLVSKAWSALAANDLNAVVAYVNKITDIYAVKAHEMQEGLKDYASGGNDDETPFAVRSSP